MLLRKDTLDGIRAGRIALAFRRWKRPTVKTGGTLRTSIGVLAIDAVEATTLAAVTETDARKAGYPGRDDLVAALRGHDGTVYRIVLRYQGEDPRAALRQTSLDADALSAVAARLDRLDRASRRGPWTRAVLRLIGDRPGIVARELAALRGEDRDPFKANVRKLKELGLTESLDVGYRLSERGRQFLDRDE